MRRGGSIVSQVTKSQRFSADLAQGGIDIPCVPTFIGREKEILKVEKLMKDHEPAVVTTFNEPPPAKKPKIEQQACDPDPGLNAVWIRFNGYLMTETDKTF